MGHRFAGDFQGLENWSASDDALQRLAGWGVEASFANLPVHEVTFYDRRLHPVVAPTMEPMFYLVRRGPEAGSLDHALLAQARDAGVEVSKRTGSPLTSGGRCWNDSVPFPRTPTLWGHVRREGRSECRHRAAHRCCLE